MRALPVAACLLCLISLAAARPAAALSSFQATGQATAPEGQLPEVYRLRLTNTLYGAVEASADKGATWLLIGRVVKPAIDRAPGAESTLPTVQRASSNGWAFGIGANHLVRVLPDLPASRQDPMAIVVNLAPGSPFFKELLPPIGSAVQLNNGSKTTALPSDYMPQDGDRILVTAPKTDIPKEKLTDAVKEISTRYSESALARLKAEKRKPISGFLTMNANLAEGDVPNAFKFFMDGETISIQNRAPFTLRIDTHRWPNGEHLLEARALNASLATLTHKKILIFIDNPPEKKP
jgi:hypothetical protein